MSALDDTLVMSACRGVLRYSPSCEVKTNNMTRRFVISALGIDMRLRTGSSGVTYTVKGPSWKFVFVVSAGVLISFEVKNGNVSDINSDMMLLRLSL